MGKQGRRSGRGKGRGKRRGVIAVWKEVGWL
jgi:hypothetical protein